MKIQFLILCFASSFAQAQTWLGSVNTDWNTPGNWQGGSVPATNTTALFDGTSTNSCVISGTISAGGINIAAGYTGTVSIASGSSVTLGGSGFTQASGTFNCGSGGFTVGNTSNFNCSGGTFIASSNTITLGNNVNLQRSFQHNNGTVLLNSGSGTTTISVNGSNVDTATLYNLTLNMSGSTNNYTVSANNKLIVVNTLHIIQGCLNGSISGADTSGVMLSGDFIDDQTGANNNQASTIDIIFGGSTNTSITMAPGGEGLFNGRMTLRKDQPTNTVTLNSDLVLHTTSNRINFISGKLVTTTNHILTIGINGINLINANNNSFVDGPMNKIGGGTPDNAFVFPIGDNGAYAPLTISGSASALSDYVAPSSHTFQAEYFRTDPNPSYNTSSKDLTLANIGRCEYWRLDKIADLNGNASPYVWLSYDSARSCGISVPASLRVTKWDATAIPAAKWINLGASTPVLLAGVPYLPTSSAVTSFSPFNLASTDGSVNPLPLNLTAFEGNVKGQDVLLHWTTGFESDISSFTVERSSDGILFKALGDINAANQASLSQHYRYNDVSLPAGRYYYRLRVNSTRGDIGYSKVIALILKDNTNNISVYPNPVVKNQAVSLFVPGCNGKAAIVKVCSLDGRILLTQPLTFNQVAVADFEVDQSVSPGLYFLTVQVERDTYRTKFFIE